MDEETSCVPFEDVIKTFNKIADFIEVDTKDHSRRVKNISTKLGIAMGWSGAELLYLGYGADIHDIGKIAINPVVFRQPTKLTKAQYLAVQSHPEFGLDMLSYCKAPKIVRDIVYYHHEHHDGSGYPLHLRGEQIPPAASIVCVADVWESITSKRPYRVAMERQVALDCMIENYTWFNPIVYTTFMSLIEKGEL